jgi:hypothetical protein
MLARGTDSPTVSLAGRGWDEDHWIDLGSNDELGCLAPRQLALVGARASAFDRTAAIYRLAGAADRFTRGINR